MKQLKKEFIGIGEVGGFEFKQLESNGCAYLYSVTSNNKTYYEVFEHKENEHFDCVSYPRAKAFGVWAWYVLDLEKAKTKYNEITKKVLERRENKE